MSRDERLPDLQRIDPFVSPAQVSVQAAKEVKMRIEPFSTLNVVPTVEVLAVPIMRLARCWKYRDCEVMRVRTVAGNAGQGTIAHTFKPDIVTVTGGSP
jgi:hypothetical protein